MTFKNYNPQLIIASFNGVVLQGFADGTHLRIERSEDVYSTVVGTGGDVTRVRNHNKTGMVTFTLMAESISNSQLQALQLVDEATGLGRGSLYIEDLNGTILVDAAQAWIMKSPDSEYSKESAGNREWRIQCAELSMLLSGAII